MAFDFPNTPNVGDKYPTSPGPGVPQYTWNGTMWTTHGVAPPGPGKVPIWTDGSNPMTAALTLAGDPVNPTDASDKHYVDGQISTLAARGNVRYDVAQTLTSGQQAQAQSNIGIVSPIPSGTVMVFYQAVAPTGWTQVTTQNDKALRVVSGSGGVTGGTNPFSTVMAQTATGNHTLTLADTAAGIKSNANNTVTTYMAGNPNVYVPTPPPGITWGQAPIPGTTGSYIVPFSGSGASIGYTSYGQYTQNINVNSNNTGGGAHNHPLTMDIQYCDVILASKT